MFQANLFAMLDNNHLFRLYFLLNQEKVHTLKFHLNQLDLKHKLELKTLSFQINIQSQIKLKSVKHNLEVKIQQTINLLGKEHTIFVDLSQSARNIAMNLKVYILHPKKEKVLHKQDQGLRFAIIVSLKPIFHVPVHLLFQYAQFAIDPIYFNDLQFTFKSFILNQYLFNFGKGEKIDCMIEFNI